MSGPRARPATKCRLLRRVHVHANEQRRHRDRYGPEVDVPWGPGRARPGSTVSAPMGRAPTSSGPTWTGRSWTIAGALTTALDKPEGSAPLGGPRPGRLDRGDRRGRPVALDAGPRGAADRPRPAPRARAYAPTDVTISVGVGRHHAVDADGDASAGRRRGRGRVSLLQPAGRRPVARTPTWGRRPRGCRSGSSGRWPRPTCGS